MRTSTQTRGVCLPSRRATVWLSRLRALCHLRLHLRPDDGDPFVERADGESLLTRLPYSAEQGIFKGDGPTSECLVRDSTWADDSAIPVDDEDPIRLVAKARRLASLAIATLEEFGLAPNLKPGKTSMMIHVAGRRSLNTGGYSRCLRRLLSTEIKGDQLFHVPLPLVHVLTDSWCLHLVAVRSRMGLLRAMVQTGPPVFWAELQQEETWLSYARADLCALAAGDSAWPPVQVESWPKWVDMIRAAPDRFKLSVKKMLQQRHLAELEGYKTDLVLWALFRMAESADPQQTSSAPIWVCRMCR